MSHHQAKTVGVSNPERSTDIIPWSGGPTAAVVDRAAAVERLPGTAEPQLPAQIFDLKPFASPITKLIHKIVAVAGSEAIPPQNLEKLHGVVHPSAVPS